MMHMQPDSVAVKVRDRSLFVLSIAQDASSETSFPVWLPAADLGDFFNAHAIHKQQTIKDRVAIVTAQ